MFQNPYMPNYYNNNFNQQSMNDRIDNQIAQLNQMKEQINKPMQQPAINQTFQLAPSNHSGMKYVNTMEEVAKEQVFIDTPFFSKDMSVLWVKDNKGNIKSYELKEIVPLDEKDMMINSLQMQLNELRKELKENAKPNDKYVVDTNQDEESTDVSNDKPSTKKSKQSSRND